MQIGLSRAAERAVQFRDTRWTMGVVGLGYVGLPLSTTAAAAGLGVVGFDIDDHKVGRLRAGRSHAEDVGDDELAQALERGARFTSDERDLSQADVLVIAVPTPLGRNRQPDLSFIEAAAATVSRVARPGQLVSLESTTYPGATEDHLVPAVRAAGLTLDRDVYVAYSPERVDPGNARRYADIPKVVGGVTEASGVVAEGAYGRIVNKVHRVGSARAAELTKLLENTYRAVNIGLVNELAQVAESFGIDIWEVIEAASTKPFGFQAFHPGPGVGGHCIPLDPQYLAWRARESGVATRFVDLAEQTNRQMPVYAAGRVIGLLNARGLAVSRARVLAVGLAYKRNVADERESPAADVLAYLTERGARVGVLEPHVPAERIADAGLIPVRPDDPDGLDGWDLAVVLTDHDGLDYARIADAVPAVFDTRGVYRRLAVERDNVVVL